MSELFSQFEAIEVPERLTTVDGRSPAFRVSFVANGLVPFPQLIVRVHGREHLFNGAEWQNPSPGRYELTVVAGLLTPGEYSLQIEGCRRLPLEQASPGDWIKAHRVLYVDPAPVARVTGGTTNGKLYFGIHKHMHQPYYDAANPNHWDGEKDGIFSSRQGAYSVYLADALARYVGGALPHAGLSASFSGTLIEQLNRCGSEGLAGGGFAGWSETLKKVARWRTELGNPRLDFVAFGFFHPLMPLIPERDIVKGIQRHARIVEETFGVPASNVMFPPETAFHVRMIPALKRAGVEVVMYDSIHRFRACRDYPYAGMTEGMLPPNRAEQENAGVDDWLQLHNVWAGSLISPSLLRPEYVKYEDPDGEQHQIIAVPCERYIGNEDARGGFGALQYPSVLGQVYDRVAQSGFDEKHPPFFILHSDGDNFGGGTDSYYRHNTEGMVEWLNGDPRFELTTVKDYLDRFPPDPSVAVHLEPGSWSGADNGDPQFMKWFSRYTEDYSPDLNSWAVLTAFQNVVHSLEDARPNAPLLEELERLLLVAETSCYWYWTGQSIWDQQVTNAANAGLSRMGGSIAALADVDRTGPTIFAPWVIPENPGGQTWGQGNLKPARREATVHTFVSDVSGLRSVKLVLRARGEEQRFDMHDRGTYPSRTGAARTANLYTVELPPGLGDIRYFIEAEDGRGNRSRSALERLWLE